MILMSRYALGEAPFKQVYLHGLVLDLNRKKMSKSHEETLIDPLDVIPKYGTDALRLSMLVGVTPETISSSTRRKSQATGISSINSGMLSLHSGTARRGDLKEKLKHLQTRGFYLGLIELSQK